MTMRMMMMMMRMRMVVAMSTAAAAAAAAVVFSFLADRPVLPPTQSTGNPRLRTRHSDKTSGPVL